MNPGTALVITLVRAAFWILDALSFFVFAWVILSWIVFFASRSSFRWKHRKVYDTLATISEALDGAMRPVLRPFRRILPPWKTGGIDFSPMLLLLVIFMIRNFLGLVFFAG